MKKQKVAKQKHRLLLKKHLHHQRLLHQETQLKQDLEKPKQVLELQLKKVGVKQPKVLLLVVWLVQEPGRALTADTQLLLTTVVDVKYDTKNYSITYKDSSNLDYTGDSIHKNYNGWIQNLNRGINAQLSAS